MATTHGIATINPADYTYVGCYYTGTSDEMQMAYAADHSYLTESLGDEWELRTEFHDNGGCAACGAHYAHGIIFRHADGRLIGIGHTCASNFEHSDRASMIRARNTRAAKAAGERVKARLAFWEMVESAEASTHPGIFEALNVDHYITNNIREKGQQYGNISAKQADLVLKIQADELAAAEEEEAGPEMVPVPTSPDRFTVTGEVLAIKWVDHQYGSSRKMLVMVDAGDGKAYKLWGSAPSAADPDKGDVIEFTAAIERSKDDESFGFFKRPTKASIKVKAEAS